MALELSDVDQLVLVLHGEVHRLSDLLHQPAHDRPSEGDDAAVAQEGVADIERADADHPDAVLLIEGGDAALLPGGQQAVGGGGRKSARLGAIGRASCRERVCPYVWFRVVAWPCT